MDDLAARAFADQWTLFVLVTALLLVLAEVGYRLGRGLHAARDEPRRSQIGVVQGAVLGMMGLLLGFTFSMAVTRYDTRRDLVLKEANAVGTTWLRASLLSEEHRGPVRNLLREYVDVRLRTQAEARDPQRLAEGLRRSAAIQSSLWQHAEAAVTRAPIPITGLFVTTLNEMIDADAERIAAGRNQIPGGVWLLLVVVAGFACYTGAYAAGAHGVRTAFTSALVPLLIAVVILLIFDLTHERQGVIGVSQQPLIDLQRSFESTR